MTVPANITRTALVRDALEQFEHRGRKNVRCIVFVHGLTGHMESTWKKDASSDGFAELILSDTELQDYDVVVFGYRSRYFRGAPIDNAARQLEFALTQLPHQYSSIVLVAHSMGGLVCMQFIINELQRSVVPPITGLLLYGTPTTGSELINVAKLIGYGIGLKIPFVRSLVNLFLRGQRQVADLATGSEFLARLHSEWAYRVVNGGHERAGAQRMWLPVRVVTGEDDKFVREASGKGVYGAIDWQPLSYGHIQLVKPEHANDLRYLAAKSFLQISRRFDPRILDRMWQAGQEIWKSRSARVSEQLDLTTVIHDKENEAGLSGFGRCETFCEYDFILENDYVEFGISIGEGDIWARSSLPIYVHQIGLNFFKQSERAALRGSIDRLLTNDDEHQVWSRLFPSCSISLDGARLLEGPLVWPPAKRLANWILRRYELPAGSEGKIGTKVRMRVDYTSVVPLSLPHFIFSAPWIVNGAKARVVVYGEFEFFVADYRLVPRGRADYDEDIIGDRGEATFSCDGIMLPGSAFDVRWRRNEQTSHPSDPKRREQP